MFENTAAGLGGLVFALIIIGAIFMHLRARKRKKQSEEETGGGGGGGSRPPTHPR